MSPIADFKRSAKPGVAGIVPRETFLLTGAQKKTTLVVSSYTQRMATTMAITEDKRKAFAAAVKLAGTTETRWAVDRGYNPTHLSLVLNGRRESATLVRQIEEFTAEQFALAS